VLEGLAASVVSVAEDVHWMRSQLDVEIKERAEKKPETSDDKLEAVEDARTCPHCGGHNVAPMHDEVTTNQQLKEAWECHDCGKLYMLVWRLVGWTPISE